MRNSLLLILVTLIAGYTVFEHGGVTDPEWSYTMMGGCVVALALFLPRRQFAPAPDRRILFLLILPPAWTALQLAPLPLPWLAAIDPARAELLSAAMPIDPAQSWAPVSVAATVTFAHLLRLLTYILVFFVARELSWRTANRPWMAAVPIVCVATLEAALGLAQSFSGGHATGTYVNPDHFSALLQMALPLTLMLAVYAIRRGSRRLPESMLGTAVACLLLACCATLFLGALYSLSRMGLAVILVSCCILAGLGVSGRFTAKSRMLAAAAPVAILLIVFFVAPEQLVNRFSRVPGGNELTADARIQFWKETLNLFRAYPLFGCGLGTYGSAIQKFRVSSPLGLLEYAHNDYLQLLAELGAIGFIPSICCGALLLLAPWRSALRDIRTKHRLMAMGCAASLAAIALASLVDFNFYIPANAMVAAWIAGMGSVPGFNRPAAPASDRGERLSAPEYTRRQGQPPAEHRARA